VLSIRDPADVLEHEMPRKGISTLGRLGRGPEAALSALRAFEAAHHQATSPSREDRLKRDRLATDAG
jgi:hypothetical protein